MAIAGDEGRDTIRKTSTDVKRTGKLRKFPIQSKSGNPEIDPEQMSPSTLYTEALRMSLRYQELQESKKEELITEIEIIRQECKKYGIDFSEVVNA